MKAVKSDKHDNIIAKVQRLVEKGQCSKAHNELEKALGEGALENEEIRANAFLLLGRIAYLQGNFNTALLHLKIAQQKAPTTSWLILEALRNEGNVHLEKGDLEGTLDCYMSALRIARQLDNRKAIAACLNNDAIANLRLGEFDLALDFFSKGFATATELANNEEAS